MPELSNEDVVGIVRKWQRDAPIDMALKCDNDNCWDVLEPVESGGKVVLKCTNCRAEMSHSVLSNFLRTIPNSSEGG